MPPPNDLPRPVERSDGTWFPAPTDRYVAERLRYLPDYMTLAEQALREQHAAGQRQVDICEEDKTAIRKIYDDQIRELEGSILKQERGLPWWAWALIGAGAGVAAGLAASAVITEALPWQ